MGLKVCDFIVKAHKKAKCYQWERIAFMKCLAIQYEIENTNSVFAEKGDESIEERLSGLYLKREDCLNIFVCDYYNAALTVWAYNHKQAKKEEIDRIAFAVQNAKFGELQKGIDVAAVNEELGIDEATIMGFWNA